jgi:two-component system response regulator NreC
VVAVNYGRAADRGSVPNIASPSPSSSAQGPTTIVLADDHTIVRSALTALLDAEAGFEVVAQAGDVGDAVRRVLAYKPHVLVLDLSMPGGSSLEAIPRMRSDSPMTAIVVLTMEDEPRFAREALRAGALGFVLKEAADTELVAAVRAAAAGLRYLNPQLGADIAAAADAPTGPPDGLSDREVEVLRLVVLGHTNAEISEQLFLSVRTVETHRSSIQHKTHTSTRAALVAYAREHGVLLDGLTGP